MVTMQERLDLCMKRNKEEDFELVKGTRERLLAEESGGGISGMKFRGHPVFYSSEENKWKFVDSSIRNDLLKTHMEKENARNF